MRETAARCCYWFVYVAVFCHRSLFSMILFVRYGIRFLGEIFIIFTCSFMLCVTTTKNNVLLVLPLSFPLTFYLGVASTHVSHIDRAFSRSFHFVSFPMVLVVVIYFIRPFFSRKIILFSFRRKFHIKESCSISFI
jgi:hypothetical protein